MKRLIERRNENIVEFRDDDAAGYKFRLLRANDGDFHLSVLPDLRDMDDDQHEAASPCYSASIRVRMPMIGGGSHEELYTALAKLWRVLEKCESRVAEEAPT